MEPEFASEDFLFLLSGWRWQIFLSSQWNGQITTTRGAGASSPSGAPMLDIRSRYRYRCSLREARPGVFQTGGFPTFSGKVQIVSRTLSGLFLVGALNRPRRGKGQIGKVPGPSPSKSGKSQINRESPKKDKKGQKRKDQSRSGKPPV